MKLEVLKIADQPDGSAIAEFEMDRQTLEAFARIGILHSIKEQIAAFEAEQALPPVKTTKRKKK